MCGQIESCVRAKSLKNNKTHKLQDNNILYFDRIN